MTQCRFHILRAGHCYHPAAMAKKGASLCATEFPALAGLILHPTEGAVLFDTGYDPAFFRATQPMPERLYRWATPVTLRSGEAAVDQLRHFGLAADDVRTIVISHFHGDHVAGLHAFTKARLICSRHGADQLTKPGRFNRVRQGLLAGLAPHNLHTLAVFFEDKPKLALGGDWAPFTTGVDIFGDASLIAVPLPGHCIGHWGLILSDVEGRPVFLIGDAAWSSAAVRDSIPPPRITTALLGHTETYRTTLRALTTLQHRNTDVLIAPSHCPEIAALAHTPS
jgi:glyoxylase-like metal-dependent hydrolase (beta-lactamase superfamily II)